MDRSIDRSVDCATDRITTEPKLENVAQEILEPHTRIEGTHPGGPPNLLETLLLLNELEAQIDDSLPQHERALAVSPASPPLAKTPIKEKKRELVYGTQEERYLPALKDPELLKAVAALRMKRPNQVATLKPQAAPAPTKKPLAQAKKHRPTQPQFEQVRVPRAQVQHKPSLGHHRNRNTQPIFTDD